jgi:hypothetical protein
MAKAGPTNMPVSGKVNGLVYTRGKYGSRVRKAPLKGSRKKDIALLMQNGRTKFLNNLAGELNSWLSIYHERLKSSDFYVRLQKCFRKEPLDNRFLLLMGLKGFEINPNYPLGKLGTCKLTVKEMTSSVKVSLQVEHHPDTGRYRANCYYDELLLLSWDKSKTRATADRQLSEWIYFKNGKPEFEFMFPKPAGTTHWLLCLRQCLGVNEVEVNSMKGEGMQVVEVGTFDKKEQALWNKLIAEREEMRLRERVRKPKAEEVRVKAKRVK